MMPMETASLTIENFENYFNDIAELVFRYRNNLDQEPIIPSVGYPELYDAFVKELPYKGAAIEDLLTEVREKIVPNSSKVRHPRFLAWMNNAGCDAGFLGDMLNIGLNQNPFMYKAGPAVTVIEDIVIQWMGHCPTNC
jgi:aromatic-L-amino-acid/L-tryptophan decarboxylase